MAAGLSGIVTNTECEWLRPTPRLTMTNMNVSGGVYGPRTFNSGRHDTTPRPGLNLAGGPVSVIVAVHLSSVASTTHFWFDAWEAMRVGGVVGGATRRFTTRYSDNASLSNDVAKPWDLGVLTTVVMTNDGATTKYWVNGELQFERTKAAFMGNPPNNVGFVLNLQSGAHAVSAVFRSVFEPEQARDLSINPYQVFRADPVRIYSLPSGPVIPTLSAASFAGRIPSVSLSY